MHCRATGPGVSQDRGGLEISRDTTRVNTAIQAPQLRVIDSDGKQLGVLPRREALRLADERQLDLVEVAPNADPPVAKLMDFGKYQYEKAKREREARKSRKEIEIKEVRLRPKTDDHDINFKVRQARSFLQSGAKVKVRMRFRGREIYNLDVAKQQFDRFASELEGVGVIEQRPSFEGRTMLMIMAPDTGRK
ncbi:MAG: translation initiation factor IF-3 [Anaerolineae bacterium]